MEFPGAIVLVTHDRYLLDRVANTILALDGRNGARTFADYAQWQSAEEERGRGQTAKKAPASPRKSSPSPARRLTYMEQRELEQMEATIAECELAIAAHQRRIENPQTLSDHVKLRAACEQLEAAQAEINRLYGRWEELEAKRNS